MTARFHTSAPTHRAFMTRKHWMHPGRREFLFRRVQGLPDIRRPKVVNKIAQFLKGAEVSPNKRSDR